MCLMGWRLPISLLECMMVMSTVFSVIADRMLSTSTRPWDETGTAVYVRRLREERYWRYSVIAGCSMEDVMTCGSDLDGCSLRNFAMVPQIAQLSASVPQLQKQISSF